MSATPTTVAAGAERPAMPEPMTMSAVLKVPVMRRLWTAQLISVFGDFLALFAVINFIAFKLHGSPEQLTGLQIAYLAPIAVLGILAGVFVDRWPLKPTMVGSDLTRAGLCLLLLFSHSVIQFYLVMGAISVVSSFFGPAQGVAIRSAVPLHGLRSANALMQQVMFGMRIVGPPLAGVLYVALGAKVCYIVDAISFVGSATLIASVALNRTLPPPSMIPPGMAGAGEKPKAGIASILPDMKQGLSFIFHHAGLLFVIVAMAAGMFVLGCFGPLIAVYTRDTLHASTRTYSAISAMIGVGMFAGVNVLNTAGKKISNTLLVYSGLLGIALGVCFLAFLPYVWAALVGDLIIGLAVAGIIVPASTLIQQETPPALMGRVGSTNMSLIFGAQILGLVLSGVMADRLGVRNVFAACAVMLVVLSVAGKLFMEPKKA
jgi:MFS transporter, DHA3 family, macrolide efflux protein